MKNNEALFSVIGELKPEYIPDLNRKRRKSKKFIRIAAGSTAAAAAVCLFAVGNLNLTEKHESDWNDYRIFSENSYKENIILSELPKIQHDWFSTTRVIYEISELENGNPWSEELNLTEMPVFKNLAYYENYYNYYNEYSEGELLETAKNAAVFFETSVDSYSCVYTDGESTNPSASPYMLVAECSGESAGTDKIEITVYGYGIVDVAFSNEDGTPVTMPKKYDDFYRESDNGTVKHLRYLTEQFNYLSYDKDPILYFTEEQLREIAQNVAAALGTTVESYFSSYSNGGAEVPNNILSGRKLVEFIATCGGESVGVDKINIEIYNYGEVEVVFLNEDGTETAIPEEYTAYSADSEAGRKKQVEYYAEKFKNLLQFENPVVSRTTMKSLLLNSRWEYTVYNKTDDPIQDILNYFTSYAQFGVYSPESNTPTSVMLMNFLTTSEHIGNYPIISPEEAEQMLMTYNSYIPQEIKNRLKGGRVNKEDILKTELIYIDGYREYYEPYYYIYIELEKSDPNDSFISVGEIAVPAVEKRYFGEDETDSEEEKGEMTEEEEILNAYPAEEVWFLDGSRVSKYEAASVGGTVEVPELEFDFGVCRLNILCDSIIRVPGESDSIPVFETDYVKLKAKDNIINSLTVKNAGTTVAWEEGNQVLRNSYAEFEGAIAYTGYLLHSGGDNDRILFLPEISARYQDAVGVLDSERKGASEILELAENGKAYVLENTDSLPEFSEDSLLAVEITLNNLYFSTDGFSNSYKAEPVSFKVYGELK